MYLEVPVDSVQRIIMRNHFDSDDVRTNNMMRFFGGDVQSDINKAVRLLRIYETTAHDKYKDAQKRTARPPDKHSVDN
jgi:hypothetical protein